MHTLPSDDDKFKIVLEHNTFFSHNKNEETYESYINALTNHLLLLKNELEHIQQNEKRKQIIIDFVRQKPDGLTAVLALLGISREILLRIVTFIRVTHDPDLDALVHFSHWGIDESKFKGELPEATITKLARDKEAVAMGLVNLFFEGATIPILRKALPLFELKKLNFAKLEFTTESLIDTIIRYKTKGSYAAFDKNNATTLLAKLLTEAKIPYKLNQNIPHIRRAIDFVLPTTEAPKIIIESSYVVTTSSGMGDKAKTEIEVAKDIKQHYPNTIFIGFVDGIGWYVRQGDLKRIVSAFDDVFTFSKGELDRFVDFAKTIV